MPTVDREACQRRGRPPPRSTSRAGLPSSLRGQQPPPLRRRRLAQHRPLLRVALLAGARRLRLRVQRAGAPGDPQGRWGGPGWDLGVWGRCGLRRNASRAPLAPEASWESWETSPPRCRARRSLQKTATFVCPAGPAEPKGLTMGHSVLLGIFT